MRFENNNLEGTGNYDFDDTTFYQGNEFNQDPDFENPFENLMRIGDDSGANGIALDSFASLVQYDILGKTRNVPMPDSGAYQSVVFED